MFQRHSRMQHIKEKLLALNLIPYWSGASMAQDRIGWDWTNSTPGGKINIFRQLRANCQSQTLWEFSLIGLVRLCRAGSLSASANANANAVNDPKNPHQIHNTDRQTAKASGAPTSLKPQSLTSAVHFECALSESAKRLGSLWFWAP